MAGNEYGTSASMTVRDAPGTSSRSDIEATPPPVAAITIDSEESWI